MTVTFAFLISQIIYDYGSKFKLISIKEAENLEMATQEIKSGIDEMASGADQINAAVNEITNKNQRIISTVLNEVSKFKL